MKPNAYLLRQQAKKELDLASARRFTMQQCKDILLLAAHDEFGFGEDRLKRLSDAFDAKFMWYANLCIEDAKIDKEIWYTQGKLDQALKAVCGKYFVPWDERYK